MHVAVERSVIIYIDCMSLLKEVILLMYNARRCRVLKECATQCYVVFKNLSNNVVRAIPNSETESLRVLNQAHILCMYTLKIEVVFYYCACRDYCVPPRC